MCESGLGRDSLNQAVRKTPGFRIMPEQKFYRRRAATPGLPTGMEITPPVAA
jgi:hypothetical protein